MSPVEFWVEIKINFSYLEKVISISFLKNEMNSWKTLVKITLVRVQL